MRRLTTILGLAPLLIAANAADALEVMGRVSSIDLEVDRITLENGQIFEAPGDNLLFAVGEGACVVVTYDISRARKVISDITVLSAIPAASRAERSGDPCVQPDAFPPPEIKPSQNRRRFKFRQRPLPGEPAGKIEKPLPE